MPPHVIAVDVGSASVRGAVVSTTGVIISEAEAAIKQHRPLGKDGHVEQSSCDIWKAVCDVVKKVVVDSEVDHSEFKGIGFDATCSMVVKGKDKTLAVTDGDDESSEWDVIMWMDHRALSQAETINATKHPVLQYVGGSISPEMAMSKIKWLKDNKPPSWWSEVDKIYELPDWLSCKAANTDIRSLCTTVCKCNYVTQEVGWNESYLNEIGLSDCLGYIGSEVAQIGTACGELTEGVLQEFGISANAKVTVASSLIDAHAGGMALCTNGPKSVAVIAGTSACFMAVHPEKNLIPGIWGPYLDAMIPNMWLSEAGMSAFGLVLDKVLLLNGSSKSHAEVTTLVKQELEGGTGHFFESIKNIHIYPDFMGNRSPVGDPTLVGMISGVTLDEGDAHLAKQYAAAVYSLCYGVRHALEVLKKGGYEGHMSSLTVAGGIANNPIFAQSLADATSLPVDVVTTSSAMLIGTAITAATSASIFPNIKSAQEAMSPECNRLHPDEEAIPHHEKRYQVFLEMLKDQLKYRKMMK